MFDALLRPLIDPVLDRMGAALVRVGIGANPVSLAGAASGALAGVAIGLGQPLAGLVLVLASRLPASRRAPRADASAPGPPQ